MNVLFLSTDTRIFEEGSDVARRMRQFCKIFNEVHIIVAASCEAERSELAPNIHVHSVGAGNSFVRFIHTVRLGTKIIRNSTLEVREWTISAQDPFELGFAGWRIARKTRAALQLQLHTNPFSEYFTTNIWNRIRVMLMRFLLPRATCVRVVSTRLRNFLADEALADPNCIHVVPVVTRIPENVDANNAREELARILPNAEFRIVAVGRFAPEKRYHEALQVLADVRANYGHAGLVFIGDGSEYKALVRRANELGISEHVAFAGWRDDPASLLAGADAFLHTSQFEGYGRVLLEAAGVGVPVITTDVGIASEVFKDGESAAICPVGGVNCLAERLRTLIGNGSLRQEMEQKGMVAAKKAALGETAYLRGVRESIELCHETRTDRSS